MKCKLVLTADRAESGESLALEFDDLDDLVLRLAGMCDGGRGIRPYAELVPFIDRLVRRIRRAGKR